MRRVLGWPKANPRMIQRTPSIGYSSRVQPYSSIDYWCAFRLRSTPKRRHSGDGVYGGDKRTGIIYIYEVIRTMYHPNLNLAKTLAYSQAPLLRNNVRTAVFERTKVLGMLYSSSALHTKRTKSRILLFYLLSNSILLLLL